MNHTNGETVEVPRDESSSLVEVDRPKIALIAGTRPELAEETRNLLRGRLRLAALVLLTPTLLVILRRWLGWSFGQEADTDFLIAYSYVVFAAVIVSNVILWSRVSLSLSQLRALELAMFGLLAVQFLFMHHNLLQAAAASRHTGPVNEPLLDEDKVLMVLRTILGMWFAMVTIYGTYIPNSLRRGAAMLAVLALVPLAIVCGTAYELPLLRPLIFPAEFTLLASAMTVAFVTALYGSYKISALRQEAFEARQLGQYRLTEQIGSGGMGDVYLAEHQMLKRPCAIKLIHPGQAADAKALARFEREVQAIARLTHWNTVEIFDYGRADDGTFYYAMEYLPGLSLQEVVERQGPLQPERAVHLLRQVCGALAEAHAAGIVHRDIKPSNIVASQRGGIFDVAKLVDFGLATTLTDVKEIKLTQEGAIAGSPLYMAPERFLEDKQPDARCDIYSLGAVAYYLLTGQPPFRGDTPIKVMIAHAREPVVPPRQLAPTIPEDLERIVLRCLAKNPEDRFQSTTALEAALAACDCANAWTQDLAARWWTSRPDSISGETRDELGEATVA
jgi:serine/threonine-protein kinase